MLRSSEYCGCCFVFFGFVYSWSTLLWYWCYYPHRPRDSMSPVCGIFSPTDLVQFPCLTTLSTRAILTCRVASEHSVITFLRQQNTKLVFATKWHILTYLLTSLLQGGRASDREARPLTGRPGLSQGGRVSYREAWPLTGMPSLSQ